MLDDVVRIALLLIAEIRVCDGARRRHGRVTREREAFADEDIIIETDKETSYKREKTLTAGI